MTNILMTCPAHRLSVSKDAGVDKKGKLWSAGEDEWFKEADDDRPCPFPRIRSTGFLGPGALKLWSYRGALEVLDFWIGFLWRKSAYSYTLSTP